ncbi:MAG: elongation factor G, partial [Gammaproteobacteria bacterium]|nr:elongation factor G [Gammaproteobacteria bacterium]
SETVWRQADKYGVPRIAFVNKMDRMGADFLNVVGMIRERLGANAVPIQLPMGAGDMFTGIIDLIRMKAFYYHDDTKGATYEEQEIPDDLKDVAREYREKIVENLSDFDDELMEQFLDTGEGAQETLRNVMRRAMLEGNFVPVMCGSAFKNKGVQLVLDAVVDYLPDPTEVKPQPEVDLEGNETGEFANVDPEAPLRALAFKIMDDRYGALTFTRIYSGTLSKGDNVLNTATGKTERIGRLVELHADSREDIDSAQAGDIIAIIGMKNIQTGHTLCDPKRPATLEPMVFPDPVISIAVTPKDKAGAEKMGIALGKMVKEDPSFRVETDRDSGEVIIKGMGELHLDIKVDILRRTHGVDVEVGKPQVAYRESISTRVEDSYTHKKQTGGSGQFARIDYIVEPGEEGSGFEFESKITGGNVPREFWPAVEKGFKTSMAEGVLAGFPVLDVKVTLTDGAAHSVDSSAIAFETAARAAYRQSIPKATPKLLEPIMKVDVFTPEAHVGDVIGDLNRRRAMIKSQEAGTTGIRVKADAPLSEMFGYIGDLRTITSGR